MKAFSIFALICVATLAQAVQLPALKKLDCDSSMTNVTTAYDNTKTPAVQTKTTVFIQFNGRYVKSQVKEGDKVTATMLVRPDIMKEGSKDEYTVFIITEAMDPIPKGCLIGHTKYVEPTADKTEYDTKVDDVDFNKVKCTRYDKETTDTTTGKTTRASAFVSGDSIVGRQAHTKKVDGEEEKWILDAESIFTYEEKKNKFAPFVLTADEATLCKATDAATKPGTNKHMFCAACTTKAVFAVVFAAVAAHLF